MARPVILASLATAVPGHCLHQRDAELIAEMLFGKRYEAFEHLKPVFANAGISKRAISMPVEWYLQPRDWRERNEAYIAVASKLFHTAARRALDKAGLRASDIDAVVSVSSTGIATPTLEARMADALGFRPDILRIPLFGLGCAGGVSGLALAQRLADADPDMRVLLVVVELCSLAFRCDRLSKANIVATALFGDGAAAAVISGRDGGEGAELFPGYQHTWAHTLDMMGWKVDPNGFEVIFDRAIPPFARRHLRPVIEGFLACSKVEMNAVSRFSFHPGGVKVLQAIESAFGLWDGALDIERRVLREHGNMSAPTALFVLKEMLDEGHRGFSLLTALGPGFSAASLPLMARA